jgi:hypothetical protein
MFRRMLVITAAALVAAVLMPVPPPDPVTAVEGGGVADVSGGPDTAPARAATVAADIVGIAASPRGDGYWQVAADGAVFGFGDVGFFGSMDGAPLRAPITAMAASPSGEGYWLVASDGEVFNFGDAGFFGSAGGVSSPAPIVGMAASPSGDGYWLVASDGEVLNFGDAGFFGSAGGVSSPAPIVGMAASPSGGGYWLTTSDGGVFTFGDAEFRGSPGGSLGDDSAAGMAVTPDGAGYWIATVGGRVLAYGSAADDGSLATGCHDRAVVGIAARSRGGYWLSSAAEPREILPPHADPIEVVVAQSGAMQTLLRVRQACQPMVEPSSDRVFSPLPDARVTAGFGWRTHPVFRMPQFHTGIDLAGRQTVLAPADGVVVQVEVRPGYGLTTIIDHGDGIATVLAHLAAVAVHPGDHVTRGQSIGTEGHSGYATGDHLHFEVRLHGVPTDPRRWL